MSDYLYKLKEALNFEKVDIKYSELCIEYASRLINNNMPVIYDKKHFSLLLGIEQQYINKLVLCTDRFYKKFSIRKKNGGDRIISIPNIRLRCIQRWILDNIIYNIRVSENVTGFIPNKSIVDNARAHVDSDAILALDIKDFFPSISFDKIFRLFNYYGYTTEISYCLARICTLNNTLPQGAPTSPYLANIVCKKMDKRISSLSKKIGAKYTRYADDITISGKKNITSYSKLIKDIIRDEGFLVNNEKTRVMYRNRQQRVTGLIVNKKITVPKEKIRYLRQQIYYINKYGVVGHREKSKVKHRNIKEHLYGLAYFIKMVDEIKGEKFLNDLNKINWES
ncbi:retron St85 family RNA-directed DNA polymerase [Desnuesiella massiliensis]|uniref:retron St85 family RNA-directed DNA polymerase n=1 Tax=Desnuesiella massiliensis TaxID=1650662 RepID=UPI0006E3B137|nr:retron St85 family RNA-directed DNA polymerase [Desnuesiella massiliensis]